MKALSSTQVFYQGQLQPATVVIDNELIVDVITGNDISQHQIPDQYQPLDQHDDHGDLVIMPGLVDSHVHINEPGRTDWEGFNSATQAAAGGGITTVIDMPLNCIPVTTDLAALHTKMACLQDQLWVDIGFHGGVIPGNADELKPLLDAGVKSFKAFMIDSGVDEFPASDLATLDLAMPILAAGDATLLVHAELPTVSNNSTDNLSKDTGCDAARDLGSYEAFLDSRPDAWEVDAIAAIITLSKKHHCKVHVVHLSSAMAISMIAEAKSAGVQITAETCPHYLTLSAETIPDGDARFKCCPPIRSVANQDLLWQGLQDGTIDFIVSDHSPCTPSLKLLETQNLWEAWGGISSLQFGLSLIWTAIKQRGYSMTELVQWMCEKPAYLAGLEHCKGQIAKGYHADLVIWDPKQVQIIDAKKTFHKHKASAYEQVEVYGQVQQTLLRGEVIYNSNDAIHFDYPPKGQALI